MTADDLALLIGDALVAAGHPKVPVVPPGTPVTVLPAVSLIPGDNELGDGNRSLRYGMEIVVYVPRSSQPEQYQLLCELEAITLRSIIPTQVRFDGPIRFSPTGGESTGEPPAQARYIPVTFATDVDLC